jgi:hypothetical protein
MKEKIVGEKKGSSLFSDPKDKHKQNARKKLAANSNFMTLFESSFPIQHHKACASRMINALNKNVDK